MIYSSPTTYLIAPRRGVSKLLVRHQHCLYEIPEFFYLPILFFCFTGLARLALNKTVDWMHHGVDSVVFC